MLSQGPAFRFEYLERDRQCMPVYELKINDTSYQLEFYDGPAWLLPSLVNGYWILHHGTHQYYSPIPGFYVCIRLISTVKGNLGLLSFL